MTELRNETLDVRTAIFGRAGCASRLRRLKLRGESKRAVLLMIGSPMGRQRLTTLERLFDVLDEDLKEDESR